MVSLVALFTSIWISLHWSLFKSYFNRGSLPLKGPGPKLLEKPEPQRTQGT